MKDKNKKNKYFFYLVKIYYIYKWCYRIYYLIFRMLKKTKYTVLILSANIFLCSAEKRCEFLNLFITKKQDDIKNTDTNTIELPELLQNQIGETSKDETRLDNEKKEKEVITLKMLLDYGLKQKANEVKEESVEKTKEKNLEIIKKFIKDFELSSLPKILKKIVNTKNLIDAYKEDETFQNLSCVEQMKLVLMFWCLQSKIEFGFPNETIEQFTQKITYSSIKNILNREIEELIKEEKKTKKETSEENISEEDSKNWESYNIFKISGKEKIKDLFYSFIKGCILTSTAILIHKYCALCKDKFGEVFIGENKGDFTDYTYTQKSSGLLSKSDVEDTIAKTQNLFSKNSKYTRICNISFEDITTLIGILTKLPNFNEFITQCNNESSNEVNDENKVDAFQNYKKLLDFVTEKKNVEKGKKNKFDDSIHFYDIMKFFDMKIEVNDINKEQTNEDKDADLEIVMANTFGELVDKVNNNIEESLKNIKNIIFKSEKSNHTVLNLSFANCKFINPDIDINELIEEEKNEEGNDVSSDDEASDDDLFE